MKKCENYTIKESVMLNGVYEFSMSWNGYKFLVVYGKHENGWFVAIPNWGVCTESGHPSDIFYNTEKLSRIVTLDHAPQAISMAINTHWNSVKLEELS